MDRFNESRNEEFEAVHKTLNIIESLIEIIPTIATVVCDKTKLMHWLIKKLNPKNQVSNLIYKKNYNIN